MHLNALQKNLLHYLVLTLLLVFSLGAKASAETPEFTSLIVENDFFVGDDSGYTSGVGITFGKGPFLAFDKNNLPNWLHWITQDLYISTMNNKQRGVAHMFFQRIQTPENIRSKEIVQDDIPYAGLLAWQGTLYAWDDQVSDHLSLYLGAVGPITLAEQSQALAHKILGSQQPQGWEHQIGNEPIFKIEAQRAWTLFRSDDEEHQLDIIGLYGGGVGNLESDTKAGIALRWGSHLAHSFSTFSLDADRQANPLAFSIEKNFYLFIGAKLGVVFNSILIEGNTFKSSHSAHLKHSQNQVSAGAVWNIGKLSSVFQLSSVSFLTKVTDERDTFGAVSFSYGY
jgi:lipid A 3-O-deacylase